MSGCEVGWNAHYRAGEHCEDCWEKNAAYHRKWRHRTGRSRRLNAPRRKPKTDLIGDSDA